MQILAVVGPGATIGFIETPRFVIGIVATDGDGTRRLNCAR